MSRTVAALYDSRDEAEIARSRLISEVGAKAPRIIGKDTAAAVDDLGIAPTDAKAYREGLQNGGHLLVAQIPRGTNAKRVVDVLTGAIGAEERGDVSVADGDQGVQVVLPDDPAMERPPEAETEPSAEPAAQPPPIANHDLETPAEPAANAPVAKSSLAQTEVAAPPVAREEDDNSPPVEEERMPLVREELRIGKQQIARGGARVRTVVREEKAEEQVVVREESIDVDHRSSDRRLTADEVEAGGLFKDRVFEVAAMRELPVITKETFVREEVIVRKTVGERTETVRDTLRHTDVKVEDLTPTETAQPALFGER